LERKSFTHQLDNNNSSIRPAIEKQHKHIPTTTKLITTINMKFTAATIATLAVIASALPTEVAAPKGKNS
jgi:hypothetical protein